MCVIHSQTLRTQGAGFNRATWLSGTITAVMSVNLLSGRCILQNDIKYEAEI
jgi:hypothetical protein